MKETEMSERGSHLDKLSIDDLCKPLSGKTQPREALLTHFGMNAEVSESRAIAVQRQNAGMVRVKNIAAARRKVNGE